MVRLGAFSFFFFFLIDRPVVPISFFRSTIFVSQGASVRILMYLLSGFGFAAFWYYSSTRITFVTDFQPITLHPHHYVLRNCYIRL